MKEKIKFVARNPSLSLKIVINHIVLRGEIRRIEREKGVGIDILENVLIYTLIRRYKPDSMIETGVEAGVSTSFILRAMAKNRKGRLISIDLPTYDPEGRINSDGVRDTAHIDKGRQPGWLVPEELKGRWELVLGDSIAVLKRMQCPDVFMHDSEHSYGHMTSELEWAFAKSQDSGKPLLLLCDDVSWNKAFDDFIGRHKDSIRQIQNRSFGIAEIRGLA
jgi:hypothetical protein